jgi:hypothetical protein
MNSKLFITCIFIVLVSHAYSQQLQKESSFQKDFDDVSNIFEDNIRPYLRKFAEMQASPKFDSVIRKQAIQSQLNLFEEKTKNLRAQSLKQILKDYENGQRVNKDYLLGYFHFLYSIQFPGLDYQYFEKCTNEVIALSKKDI